MVYWFLPYSRANQQQVYTPHPVPPPDLLRTPRPVPPLWVATALASASRLHTANPHWLSVLYTVAYVSLLVACRLVLILELG